MLNDQKFLILFSRICFFTGCKGESHLDKSADFKKAEGAVSMVNFNTAISVSFEFC